MKNLLVNILIAAIIGGFATFTSAMNLVSPVPTAQDSLQTDTTKLYLSQNGIIDAQVQIEELPRVVKSAVATKYAAYAIQKAYKGNDDTYKLILKNSDAKLIVYYKAEGTFLKAETVRTEQMVVLA